MCSIFGAFGAHPNLSLLDEIRKLAGDRGRDGGRMTTYRAEDGLYGILGNWRATPTPEVERAPLQPYEAQTGGRTVAVVHNGTIANDVALGAQPGEVDSMVLPRVLSFSGRPEALAASLEVVRGSYAIATWTGEDVMLACNYKPIHYIRRGDTIYFSSMARHLEPVRLFGAGPVQVPPYSVLGLRYGDVAIINRTFAKRAVVVCSAGLDSTTVAALLVRQGFDVCLLHFLYNCKAERRESVLIPRIADALGCRYAYLPIDYRHMHGDSPLLREGDAIAGPIEGAEWAHEWVPARNTVMLALAAAYAEANGYHVIALGNNLEEAGSYPDNEEQFTTMFDALLPYVTHDGYRLHLTAPVGHLMKHEIVKVGLEAGAPYELTWSCYRGGERHCGQCGPCFMRRTAFERNGVPDPVFSLDRALAGR